MKTVQERFDDKYIPEPMSGCWLWTASIGKHGYGIFKYGSVMKLAHRISWMLHNGPIPEIEGADFRGTCVLHKCDVRSCVNPDHLFLGTHRDNIIDMESKGRSKHPNGENSGLSKLTANDVRCIRKLYLKGDTSNGKLAHIYGVDRTTIWNVVSFKTWRHIK